MRNTSVKNPKKISDCYIWFKFFKGAFNTVFSVCLHLQAYVQDLYTVLIENKTNTK